jgi:hypothetical protein
MISVSKSFGWFKLLPFLILGFLIYSNTLEVPFYFDDEQNIVKNPLIRLTSLTFEDITKAALQSYASNRPIANVSFALNYYFHQYDGAIDFLASLRLNRLWISCQSSCLIISLSPDTIIGRKHTSWLTIFTPFLRRGVSFRFP